MGVQLTPSMLSVLTIALELVEEAISIEEGHPHSVQQRRTLAG